LVSQDRSPVCGIRKVDRGGSASFGRLMEITQADA
jgi:hypothetical protein